ncbi:MAG TPA: ABC transporter substrate-binding protein [Sandaracinaceae bacterium LLY-WYZ-13_1]|nr:ABC transporter substrate-binding protein [Sandaracinaceae bacterium LLY-WYZ-13_1]
MIRVLPPAPCAPPFAPAAGRSRLSAGALLLLGLLLPASASAQEGPAARGLLTQHRRVTRLLERPASRARERRLDRALDRALDYEMITRRALVVHWEDLSAAQREEVTDLLHRAIARRYRASLEELRGWTVEVLEERPRGPGYRVVTEARHDGERRRIEYDMLRTGGEWRIVDVIHEGDSLIHQYRRQFDRVIRREGWDGFVRRLRADVDDDAG